jgi:hypothetical protein
VPVADDIIRSWQQDALIIAEKKFRREVCCGPGPYNQVAAEAWSDARSQIQMSVQNLHTRNCAITKQHAEQVAAKIFAPLESALNKGEADLPHCEKVSFEALMGKFWRESIGAQAPRREVSSAAMARIWNLSITRWKKQYEALQAELLLSQSHVETLVRTEELLHKQHEEVCNQLKKQIGETEGRLASHDERAADLERDKMALQDKIDELAQSVIDKEAQVAVQRGQLEQRAAQISAAFQQMEEGNLSDIERQSEERRQEVEAREAEAEKWKTRCQTLQMELAQQSSKAEGLQRQNEDLRQQCGLTKLKIASEILIPEH